MVRSAGINELSTINLTDWIEARLLIGDSPLSYEDVQESLEGTGIDDLATSVYDSEQSVIWEIVQHIGLQIEWRSEAIGIGYPYEIIDGWFRRKEASPEYIYYDVCLLLTQRSAYKLPFPKNYSAAYQGKIFESVAVQCLCGLLPTWKVIPTGWQVDRTEKLGEIVQRLAACMSQKVGALPDYTNPHTKDGGLDVACYLPFQDNRGASPLMLLQCASGENWRDKTGQPDTAHWKNYLRFPWEPWRALVIPFVLDSKEYEREAVSVRGPLLDRVRLVSGIDRSPMSESESVQEIAEMKICVDVWRQQLIDEASD